MTEYDAILRVWKAGNQLEVARVYAKFIAEAQRTGGNGSCSALNLEVMRKYPSKSGLRRVKELAWKIVGES